MLEPEFSSQMRVCQQLSRCHTFRQNVECGKRKNNSDNDLAACSTRLIELKEFTGNLQKLQLGMWTSPHMRVNQTLNLFIPSDIECHLTN